MRKDVFAQNFQCVEFFLRWNFQSQTARGRERGGRVFQKSALGFSNATQTSATQGEVPQKANNWEENSQFLVTISGGFWLEKTCFYRA